MDCCVAEWLYGSKVKWNIPFTPFSSVSLFHRRKLSPYLSEWMAALILLIFLVFKSPGDAEVVGGRKIAAQFATSIEKEIDITKAAVF